MRNEGQMSNATTLHFIATSHALTHATNNEGWFCECLACSFTKDYKILVQQEDGTIEETTVADAVLKSLEQQGFHTFVPVPIS
jgi:hypothetical protein